MRLCILFFLLISELGVAQPRYRVNSDIIEVTFTDNNASNDSLVASILLDSLALKSEHLIVGGNVSDLPKDLYLLKHITRIEISVSKPFSISKDLSKYKKLNTLWVWCEIAKIDEKLQLPQLETVWFKNCGLKVFPKVICKWPKLTTINLSGNCFSIIPKEIKKLGCLKELWLSNNCIKELPSEVGSLINLEKLSLSENQLLTIPVELCKLTKLQELYLNKNDSLVIPESVLKCIEGLPKLTGFYHD